MRNKGIGLLLAAVMVISLAACSGQKAEENASSEEPKQEASVEEPKQEASEDSESLEEAAVEGETMFLTIANAAQDGDSLDSAQDYFIAELSKATGGKITGSVSPNSQLGSHSDYIGSLQMGSIQVAEATAAVLPQ